MEFAFNHQSFWEVNLWLIPTSIFLAIILGGLIFILVKRNILLRDVKSRVEVLEELSHQPDAKITDRLVDGAATELRKDRKRVAEDNFMNWMLLGFTTVVTIVVFLVSFWNYNTAFIENKAEVVSDAIFNYYGLELNFEQTVALIQGVEDTPPPEGVVKEFGAATITMENEVEEKIQLVWDETEYKLVFFKDIVVKNMLPIEQRELSIQ